MKEMKGLEDQFNVLKAKHRQEVDEKQRLHQDNLAMQNQIKVTSFRFEFVTRRLLHSPLQLDGETNDLTQISFSESSDKATLHAFGCTFRS